MKKLPRTVVAMVAGAAVVSWVAPAANAEDWTGNWRQGSVTLTGTGYVTGNAGGSRNPVKGRSFWFEALNGPGVPGGALVRWVKCGHTSTQDWPSNVGGQAREYHGGYNRTGTDFLKGTCAQNWIRAKSSLGKGIVIGYGSYFNDTPIA